MRNTDVNAVLPSLHGQVITRIRRIWYVFEGRVTAQTGPVEFSFADGRTALLDAGPDGEALALDLAPWKDPFAPPLSPENLEFVTRSGKWTSFDVSSEVPYSILIGSAVTDIAPITTPEGKITGLVIVTGEAALRIEADSDELRVNVV